MKFHRYYSRLSDLVLPLLLTPAELYPSVGRLHKYPHTEQYDDWKLTFNWRVVTFGTAAKRELGD